MESNWNFWSVQWRFCSKIHSAHICASTWEVENIIKPYKIVFLWSERARTLDSLLIASALFISFCDIRQISQKLHCMPELGRNWTVQNHIMYSIQISVLLALFFVWMYTYLLVSSNIARKIYFRLWWLVQPMECGRMNLIYIFLLYGKQVDRKCFMSFVIGIINIKQNESDGTRRER